MKRVDQIWVAKGTYEIAGDIILPDKVALYGGFIGLGNTENEIMGRNIKANPTIITAVRAQSGTNCLLDGFTVRRGNSCITVTSGAHLRVYNCIIEGGGIGVSVSGVSSDVLLVSCLIRNNSHSGTGGGIQATFIGSPAVGPAVTVSNCTIVHNRATGRGIYTSGSTLTVKNSIIYGNSSGIETSNGNPSSQTIQNNLVQGMPADPANNNLDGATDPLFSNAALGDFSLSDDSPLINKGNDSYYVYERVQGSWSVDITGAARFYQGPIDIGAYENQGRPATPPAPTVLYVNKNVSGGD